MLYKSATAGITSSNYSQGALMTIHPAVSYKGAAKDRQKSLVIVTQAILRQLKSIHRNAIASICSLHNYLTDIYLDTEIGSPSHRHPLFSSYNSA